MALFLENRLALPSNVNVLTMSWCKVSTEVAISCDDNSVYFATEEGEIIDATLTREGFNCVAMDWRTTSRVISCGYDDGTIVLWSIEDRVDKKDTTTHAAAITFMQWSPDGGRLCCADEQGTVAVFKTDHRSRLTKLFKIHSGPDPVVTCEWKITPEYREKQSDMPTPPTSLFVGAASGKVPCLPGSIIFSGTKPTFVMV